MEARKLEPCQRMTADFLLQEIDSQRVIFSAGQEVFSRRDWADSVFFISQGSVEISISGITIAILFGGDWFGEHCLGQHEYRQNSATALEETTLIRIEKEDMLGAFRTIPNLRGVFVANLIRQQQALVFLLEVKLARDSVSTISAFADTCDNQDDPSR